MAKRTPIKAIRAKCLGCCCGQVAEVRECACINCALHEYRMGHRPKNEECTANENQEEKKRS